MARPLAMVDWPRIPAAASRKMTVPVAVEGVMVAERVRGVPTSIAAGMGARTVVVSSGLTWMRTEGLVEAVWVVSPE